MLNPPLSSRRGRSRTLLVLAPVLAAGTPAAFAGPPVAFADASKRLEFLHVSTPFGGDGLGGAAWFDANGDGWLDLFLTNGKTQPNALFENDGLGGFVNVATGTALENGLGNAGVVAADIDNDGFKDLFLTGDGGVMGSGDSPVKLYHNDGGTGFTDITATSGIVPPPTTLSAAFADVNNDGFLDLFISAPGSLAMHQQHRNRLYLNDGDLSFTDVSQAAGVDTALGACAVFFSDYDQDGWIDLFVADCNDVNFTPTPIELFRNNRDGTFTDVTNEAGLDPGGFWMGLAPADYDLDGDIDIFATNLGTTPPGVFRHALYRNNGDGTYTDVAGSAGAAQHEFGWGCTFRDFDNDGYPDLFFAGSLPGSPFNILGPGLGNPGTMLFNKQTGAFADWTASMPLDLSSHFTSGVAAGDLDHDGFQDLLVVVEQWLGQHGEPVLLHNQGNANGWITVRLEGTQSNRDAVGARVVVTAGALVQTQEVYAGTSFLSMDSPWLTFGLAGQENASEIRVRWPSGLTERFPAAPSGTTLDLVEGEGEMLCPADLDESGVIDFADVLAILTAWGPCFACPEDLDHSGAVDFADILIVLTTWGPCG